jgi:hypothetical protein
VSFNPFGVDKISTWFSVMHWLCTELLSDSQHSLEVHGNGDEHCRGPL